MKTPNKKYVGMSALRARYDDCSHMTIERLLKRDSTFPRPYRFNDGPYARRYWLLNEIESWERSKAVRRSA